MKAATPRPARAPRLLIGPRGLNADRHANLLIWRDPVGSNLGAERQPPRWRQRIMPAPLWEFMGQDLGRWIC